MAAIGGLINWEGKSYHQVSENLGNGVYYTKTYDASGKTLLNEATVKLAGTTADTWIGALNQKAAQTGQSASAVYGGIYQDVDHTSHVFKQRAQPERGIQRTGDVNNGCLERWLLHDLCHLEGRHQERQGRQRQQPRACPERDSGCGNKVGGSPISFCCRLCHGYKRSGAGLG